MSELIKKQVTDAKALMDKAIDHADSELNKIRAVKQVHQYWMMLWLIIMAHQPH